MTSGISITIPDMLVTTIFDQSILMHLNIQQHLSMCTSSFRISHDINICDGKHPVTVKCAHKPLPFVTLVTSTNKFV